MATSLIDKVRGAARPLEGSSDLDPLLHRLGQSRVVMLGEASHGTSEFYRWRAHITRRLLSEYGFSFVAVEGDWPDCAELTRFVKGTSRQITGDSFEVLKAFDRWPTWMWANHEVAAFSDWLHAFNHELAPERRVGFFGLDVYSLWDSLRAVHGYLERTDGEALAQARAALRCFEPFGADATAYARAVPFVSADCQDEVVELLRRVREQKARAGEEDRDDLFSAEQNALVVSNAESYYRQLVHGGRSTWNLRDRHMMETLQRLLRHHGQGAKAIVWAHNTHVGDARYTDMAESGLFNIGQLAREEMGSSEVALVGFGSHRGTVIASTEWGEPLERMVVPPAREGSWEDAFHRACDGDAFLLCDGLDAAFHEKRPHRAIGVVYHPAYERLGNYVPTVLPRRYDAFIHLDQTSALHPIHLPSHVGPELPETFPSGQ